MRRHINVMFRKTEGVFDVNTEVLVVAGILFIAFKEDAYTGL